VVNVMHIDFREMLEANRARADEVRSQLAERRAHCVHRDDGLLSDWSETMPKKLPPPTIEQVREEIADAVAGLPPALTAADVEQKIADLLMDPDRIDRQGKMISDERKRWRAEIEKLREEHDLRISALLQATQKTGAWSRW
jgi:hypothetical protein